MLVKAPGGKSSISCRRYFCLALPSILKDLLSMFEVGMDLPHTKKKERKNIKGFVENIIDSQNWSYHNVLKYWDT